MMGPPFRACEIAQADSSILRPRLHVPRVDRFCIKLQGSSHMSAYEWRRH